MGFTRGQSGNPNGRTPGILNHYGLDLLQRNKRKLLRAIVDKALAGDIVDLQFCGTRLWPPLKAVNARVTEVPLRDTLGAQGA